MSNPTLQNNNGRGIPKWLNMKNVVAAAQATRTKIVNAVSLKATASTSEKHIVVSYRDSKGHVISAEDPIITAQIAKNVIPLDLYGKELQPYKMINAHAAMADANVQSVLTEKRVTTNERQIHPSYMVDSTINRHLQYKALQALSNFANECGLYGARAKYVLGKNASVAGKQFQGYTEITADISWLVGPRFRKTVTATVGIDAGNKLVMPKVFKAADGTEYPFTKEAVGEFLKGIEFSKPSREIHRRSDVPVFKKPDPTRFKAIPR
jgi:hypothetical protein